MNIRITEAVSYVGVTDWELKTFHGEEYTTRLGSSYNSYLVRDEKTALVETVWAPYARHWLENLAKTTDLAALDYVIVNHAEPDHSGGLPLILDARPDIPVVCTANCVQSLTGHYHRDMNFQVVKTGDRLSLGARELVFIEARMLHWPDTMVCYLTGDEVLFSNDAFGQHYATSSIFNDEADPCELAREAQTYYANILTPFSATVRKKLGQIMALGLPLKMLLPSHGVVWRKDPLWIINKYLEWADDYQENRVAVCYDTMWEATREMAEAVAEGLRQSLPETTVTVANLAKADHTALITEVFRSKALVLGSPTVNKTVLSATGAFLDRVHGLGFKKKLGAAFGSYGWSGEAPRQIADRLTEAGFAPAADPLRLPWRPDEAGREKCREWGREIGRMVQKVQS